MENLTFENTFAILAIAIITCVLFRAIIKLDLATMFTDRDNSNKLSHTRFWSNIAYFVATVSFIKLNFVESIQHLLPELWLIYVGLIGGNASLSKFIAMKYSNIANKNLQGD